MATNAKETAKQENGSRYFFESVIERGKEPTDDEMKRIYDGFGAEWRSTYSKQTRALQKFLGGSKGYEYSRDTGIMPYIENIAKTECGVSVKDRWNPMDIVLVKKNQKRVVEGTIKELTNIEGMSKESKLSLLNAYMREALKEKVLIGVSLKAIAAKKIRASAEVANAGGSTGQPTQIDAVKGSLKCILTLGKKKNYLFDTGELGFDMKTQKGGQIHGQSRNFQYSKERNLVQTDLTPKGKDAGAKLGKVSSVALDKFLSGLNLNRPTSAAKHRHIPPVGKWTDDDKKYWIGLYNKLKNTDVDFGEVAVYENSQKIAEGFESVLDYAINYETEKADRSSGGRFSSKLIAMEWAHIWVQIQKKKKTREWCTALYYGAKKEFGDSNGPFLKIY
tara:strand:+ start:232 stop:1404 length:1173 start_codon:yes stop_codon:yes gene_type:complete